MSVFVEILKVIFLGIVEGITEWLPISSTGHMLLVDELLQLNATDAYKEMFFVVIQLGAILAVVIMFWKDLWPFEKDEDTNKPIIAMDKLAMWVKVVIACIPAGVLGILIDDWMEEHLFNPVVIAIALIVYGVIFIIIENRENKADIESIDDLPVTTVIGIGLFQCLSLIPGTSRSGSTIIGALLLGVDRKTAARFTFFLAVPVMFGASFIKLLKFGFHFSGLEALYLIIGMAVACVVSLFVIKFLMDYIRKHDFKIFGWYRIALGIIVLIFFGIKALIG